MLASFCYACLNPGVSIPSTLELHFGLLSAGRQEDVGRRDLSSYTLKPISPFGPLSHPKVPPTLPNVHRGRWEGSNGSHGTHSDGQCHIRADSPLPHPHLSILTLSAVPRTQNSLELQDESVVYLLAPSAAEENSHKNRGLVYSALSFLYSQCPSPSTGSLTISLMNEGGIRCQVWGKDRDRRIRT